MELKTAVIALKAKGDKASLKTMAYQVAQLATTCVNVDTRIVDCIITFGGTKDILREVKKLDAQKRFDYLIIYSPTQITKSVAEYEEFVSVMANEFKVEVKYLRVG